MTCRKGGQCGYFGSFDNRFCSSETYRSFSGGNLELVGGFLPADFSVCYLCVDGNWINRVAD